jgi:hypothetical protein
VLQLRRKDGRLLFTASAQPRLRERNLDDILFSGAFAPDFSAGKTLFERTDTATLYVLRSDAHGDTSVACLLADLTRQRKERFYVSDYLDLDQLKAARKDARGNAAASGEEADAGGDEDEGYSSHSSDEPPASERHLTVAKYRQPEVTRFEPRTMFFVSPEKAFAQVIQVNYGRETGYYEDAWCTLKFARGDNAASAAVSARLRFRTGSLDYEGNRDREGRPLTAGQLTKMLSHWRLEWWSCRR